MKRTVQLILITIIIVCTVILGKQIYQYYIDNKVYSDIRSIKENNILEESSINTEELMKINDEYKFWITINGTVVDYPVVQGMNNEFYLTHNFYKERNSSGTLFIDSNNKLENDKNIILYGHNMKNKTMFNEINKFKDEEFFNTRSITILSNNKKEEYEVFSVYVIDNDDMKFKLNFKDDDEYKKYILELSEKSIINKAIGESDNNKIITLVTCSYEFNNARTIIHAKLKE